MTYMKRGVDICVEIDLESTQITLFRQTIEIPCFYHRIFTTNINYGINLIHCIYLFYKVKCTSHQNFLYLTSVDHNPIFQKKKQAS